MPPLIVLLTYGSRGDVQPFFALSQALLQAGYRVRLLAPQVSSAGVVQEGSERFEFWPLEGDIDRLAQALAEAGNSLVKTGRALSKFVLPLAGRVFGELCQACSGADCIVHTFLFTAGAHTVAQELGIPEISAQFFPIYAPTAAFPAISSPDLPLGPGYRRWTHQVNSAASKFSGRWMYRSLRRDNPGLPELAAWPFDPARLPGERTPIPLAFAFSEQVVPRPADWPASVHLTGYWTQPPPADYRPPEALQRFLEAGELPVYIGFGSMLPHPDRRLVELCLEALRISGLRGVLALPGLEEAGDLPANALALPVLPFTWLFPRLAAVLHHGGAGTTAAGLHAGLPSPDLPLHGRPGFLGRARRGPGGGLAASCAQAPGRA